MSRIGRGLISSDDSTGAVTLPSAPDILPQIQGGTGQDTSALTGLAYLRSGTWYFPQPYVMAVSGDDLQSLVDGITVGTVLAPPGTWDVDDLTLKTGVHLLGCGERATFLQNVGTGRAVTIPAQSIGASAGGFTVLLGDNVGEIGACILGVDAGETRQNYLHDLEVNRVAGILDGQAGVKLDATGASGSRVVFNRMYNLHMTNVCYPIVLESHTEGNIGSMIHCDNYGAGATGVAISISGHANTFTDCWFGRGASTATLLYGFTLAGSYNRCHGIADLGTGYLFAEAGGTLNELAGRVLGTTAWLLGANPTSATWLDVTVSRVAATPYQNTGTGPRHVNIALLGAVAGTMQAVLSVGEDNTTPLIAGRQYNSTNAAGGTQHAGQLSAVIPENWYYKLTIIDSATVDHWNEMNA